MMRYMAAFCFGAMAVLICLAQPQGWFNDAIKVFHLMLLADISAILHKSRGVF